MVVVKSNMSSRNQRSKTTWYTDRTNTIIPLSRERERAMLRKESNDGTLGATKLAGSLAKKGQQEAIAVIPIAQAKPIWLRSLMGLQIASSLVTLAIVSVTLAIYGGTIYGQAKWSEEYQKLEKLRRYEQQLSVANELLKHEIAELAASPEVGLVPLDSIKPIFLSPAPLRPASVPRPGVPQPGKFSDSDVAVAEGQEAVAFSEHQGIDSEAMLPLRRAPGEDSSNSESDSKATFEIPLAY